MTNEQRAFLIERQTIRSDLPERLEEHASLGRGSVGMEGEAPDLVRARHCYIQEALVEREHEAIWGDAVGYERVEFS
jgi:hypothetical protein